MTIAIIRVRPSDQIQNILLNRMGKGIKKSNRLRPTHTKAKAKGKLSSRATCTVQVGLE